MYSPGAETESETLYRCDTDGCKSPVMQKHIQKGGCPKCGGRRMKVAVCINETEEAWLISEGYNFEKGWSDEPVLTKH